jgi:hypothetical protein
MDQGPDDSEPATSSYALDAWLKATNLIAYKQALFDEGFDDVKSLTLMPEEMIEELSIR